MSFLKSTDVQKIRKPIEDEQKSRQEAKNRDKEKQEITKKDERKVMDALAIIKSLPSCYFRKRMLEILDTYESLSDISTVSNN